MEQQVILDIEVNEHYTQIKDQQIYHATVEEMRKNTLTGSNKCPHANDEDNNENCLYCVEDEELYRQMELIPEPLFQSTNIEETDLTEKQQQQIQSNPSIVTTLGKAKFGDYRGNVTIEGFFLLCLYVNGKAK